LKRQVPQEIGEGGVHLLLGDDLIVVQDQHKVLRALREQIDEPYQELLEGWVGL
jgi:hypothetical protein